MRRKAQITGFILVGIVVMAVFGVVIYFGSVRAQSRVRETVNSLSQGFLSSSVVKYYTSECFDTYVSESLDLVGKQGGIIY